MIYLYASAQIMNLVVTGLSQRKAISSSRPGGKTPGILDRSTAG